MLLLHFYICILQTGPMNFSNSFLCKVLILYLLFSGWTVSEWYSVLLHCWTQQLILNAIVMQHNFSVMLLKCQERTSILLQSGQILTQYLPLLRRKWEIYWSTLHILDFIVSGLNSCNQKWEIFCNINELWTIIMFN